ncbi:hypothetical protein GH714_024262 [Hevea brasiliensis]|uniref:Uncharacterized protein n=1 Tax=Hevea brasiliensis TaxID=3981 RepID=A0A6A6KLZ9_HEVBR|nr:hypothetical protein GH714_024262 [Hevea brasiliensis]
MVSTARVDRPKHQRQVYYGCLENGNRAPMGEKGVVGRDVIRDCIKEAIEGESRKEMRENAEKWRNLAKAAADEGGSSDKNIREFVGNLLHDRSYVSPCTNGV